MEFEDEKRVVLENSEDAAVRGWCAPHPPRHNKRATGKMHKSKVIAFSFRLEERAEKRKQFFTMLEEKTQAREAERTNLQAKSKENQDAEIKKLRKRMTFKATPMPSFYRQPPPKVELRKIPTTRARSPKLGRTKGSPRKSVDSQESNDISTASQVNANKDGFGPMKWLKPEDCVRKKRGPLVKSAGNEEVVTPPCVHDKNEQETGVEPGKIFAGIHPLHFTVEV